MDHFFARFRLGRDAGFSFTFGRGGGNRDQPEGVLIILPKTRDPGIGGQVPQSRPSIPSLNPVPDTIYSDAVPRLRP